MYPVLNMEGVGESLGRFYGIVKEPAIKFLENGGVYVICFSVFAILMITFS